MDCKIKQKCYLVKQPYLVAFTILGYAMNIAKNNFSNMCKQSIYRRECIQMLDHKTQREFHELSMFDNKSEIN